MRACLFAILLLALPGAAAPASPPRVIADIPPVQSLVARVMDGVGAPELLTHPGASPHGHALRPSEAGALQAADLVVWVGPELTPWLARGVESLGGGASLVLRDVDGTRLLPAGAEDGAVDPHAWLDPENARTWVAAIAEALGRLDPANAARYGANAAAAAAEIDDLTTRVAARLSPHAGVGFVADHDAYRYFEARFGLEKLAALTASDAAAPGPAHVQDVVRRAVEGRARCILVEPAGDRRLARLVADEADLPVVVADPLGAALEPGPGLYPALIEALVAAFIDCFD